MIENDFFLIWNKGDFFYSDIIPNYETLFLWFQSSEKKIRVYYPIDSRNVTKLTVNRRVQSIVRSGYYHPSGTRVGLGWEIENVEEYEQFHEERFQAESKENVTPEQWLEIMEEKARKITGSKLKELDLPLVDVSVKIYVNTFEVFDRTTNKRLNKVNFYDEAHLESGEMLGNQKGFKVTTSLNEDLHYRFELLKPLSSIMTDVLILIDLYYHVQKNMGFYFGSFEIGEFTLNKATGELEVITKYSNLTHAYAYYLTSENNILIGYQSGLLQLINWNAGQALIWESSEASPATILSLSSWDRYFVAGLNDGSIKLVNKKDGSIHQTHQVAELSITFIDVVGQYALIGIENGYKIYCYDLEREVLKWELPINKGKFISLKCEEENVVVYTEKGFKIVINISTTEILEQNLGHNLTSEPSSIGPWQLLGSKNHLLYGTQVSPNMERHMEDFSRISSIITLEDGILVSNLDGKIQYLRKLVMEKVS